MLNFLGFQNLPIKSRKLGEADANGNFTFVKEKRVKIELIKPMPEETGIDLQLLKDTFKNRRKGWSYIRGRKRNRSFKRNQKEKRVYACYNVHEKKSFNSKLFGLRKGGQSEDSQEA